MLQLCEGDVGIFYGCVRTCKGRLYFSVDIQNSAYICGTEWRTSRRRVVSGTLNEAFGGNRDEQARTSAGQQLDRPTYV